MAVYDSSTHTRAGRENRSTQLFVVVAMALVAIASAVAMSRHAGFPVPIAITAALAAYILMCAIHVLLWRSRRVEDQAPAADRREQEIRRVMEGMRAGAPSPVATQRGAPPRDQQRAATRGNPPALARAPASPMVTGPLINEARASAELARPTAPHAARPALPATPPPVPESLRVRRLDEPMLPGVPAPFADPDAMQDYWSFRPAAPRLDIPPFVTGQASAGAIAPPPAPKRPAAGSGESAPQLAKPPKVPSAQPASPREADVEVIQDAIKRLLEEVNAAEAVGATISRPASSVAEARHGQSVARDRAPPLASPSTAIETSLDALRMTADTMRAASHVPPSTAKPARPASPPAARASWSPLRTTPLPTRGAAISEAISAGRIDVLLEPILALDDQRTRHFEVTVRLRNAAGQLLEGPDRDTDLRGTGLLPLFDCARIARTAAVAHRLEERGKTGSVLSAFTSESLTDNRFLGDLAENLHMRAKFSGQLVLTFSQSDVRGFGGPEWDTIADMRALGLRFALSDVTDLDMDFEALAEAGLAFVKLDADVFLDGLPSAGGGRIPASDICRHLAKLGLTLVVERIDDEEKLARVFGFGVLLGQGHLFGGPRPVRASAVTGQSDAAA